MEIEAGVKENKNAQFTSCSYFSDDHRESLGYYQEALAAGDTADEVLEFYVSHFGERSQ